MHARATISSKNRQVFAPAMKRAAGLFSMSLGLGLAAGWTPEVYAATKKPAEPTPVEAPKPVPPPSPRLAPLGQVPDWNDLDSYQRTITKEDFEHQLRHCYARNEEAFAGKIELFGDFARIIRQSSDAGKGYYDLHYLTDRRKTNAGIDRYWKAPWHLSPVINDSRPLEGLRIAVDAGHIGGDFAIKEGRYYTIGEETLPITEGDMTLRTARILEHDLTLLGAQVFLVRPGPFPVTAERPPDLMGVARDWLRRSDATRYLPGQLVGTTADRLFYLSSEIRTRANKVNEAEQPDLVLCLHFNAEPWRNPYRPTFTSKNHTHILINGCYSSSEISEDDTRHEMIRRILQRTYNYELPMANAIARTMADETDLPSMGYDGVQGKSVNDNPYVWARNLLANRRYFCPVIFFEPYCMNNREVHARVQAGEYRGLREFKGPARKNIYQEYADGITAGLVNYFRQVRNAR